MVNVRGNLR